MFGECATVLRHNLFEIIDKALFKFAVHGIEQNHLFAGKIIVFGKGINLRGRAVQPHGRADITWQIQRLVCLNSPIFLVLRSLQSLILELTKSA